MIYRISPHVLADVRSCAMRGWTRHVMGYTSVGDSIKAAAGSAYHAGMAVFLDPKIAEEGVAKRERALAALHATYDGVWDACPADKLDESYTPANLHKLFDRWMETHPRESVPWREVVEVETAFVSQRWAVVNGTDEYDIKLQAISEKGFESYTLGGYDIVELIVRPDAVVIDSTGMLRYVDTKTTGWSVTDASWLRALRLSMQTQLYADAVMRRFAGGPIAPLLGGWINACEIKKLPGSSAAPPKLKKDGTPYAASKCPLHGLPYAQCGLEHMKTVIQECTTDPESVAYAVELARKAATTFVLLHRQHQEFTRGVDPARLRDLTEPGWKDYPLRNIPVDGIANEKCRFCAAAEWCDAGRVIGAIPSTMRYDPWPVETGQRVHAA